MEQQVEQGITFKGSRWLLMFVFYLQFLVGELLDVGWSFVSAQPLAQPVKMVVVQLLAVALPCVIFMFLSDERYATVVKRAPISAKTVFLCVVTGVAAQPVAALCNLPAQQYAQRNLGGAVLQMVETPQTGGGLLVSLLVVALIPALFEEFLMRGIVLHSLEQRGYRSSLVITALLFALLHNHFESFLGLFFLGLVLCYVTWMTQSLAAAIITHFSFNAFALLLNFGVEQGVITSTWLMSGLFFACLVAVALVVLGRATSALGKTNVRRYRTRYFWRQIGVAVFNLPVLLILLGYLVFDFYYRFLAL